MADLKISELPELLSAQLQDTDPLPLADLSGSETKKISAKNLFIGGVNLLPAGSIPADKVDSSGGVVIADGSITAAKLASNSANIVAAALPASGGYVGQQCVVTGGTEPVEFTWNGTTWLKEGGVAAVEGSTTGLVNTYVNNSAGTATISADIDATSGAGQFVAGPAGAAGAVSQRVIVSTDLPTAGAQKGAVAVDGNGLAMDGDDIKIDNAVTQNTAVGHLVEYNEFGLITAGAAITSGDLPVATSTEIGAIRPASDLTVNADGELTHSNTILPGTATKVTWDEHGHITQDSNLQPGDIPDLPADKITTGSFPTERIGSGTISAGKLADYATCLIQEGNPGAGEYLGQMWVTPSTNQLRVFGGGSGQDVWINIGFGSLQANNLRWGGTVNATTSTIVSLTDIGVSEGLTAGGPVPTPSDELSGLYFVVSEGGNGITIPNVNGQTCSPGDWILYLNAAEGAIHLDISAGGGGGGGASRLNDLTDVTIDTPLAGQLLSYNSFSGLWENTSTISGGDF